MFQQPLMWVHAEHLFPAEQQSLSPAGRLLSSHSRTDAELPYRRAELSSEPRFA